MSLPLTEQGKFTRYKSDAVLDFKSIVKIDDSLYIQGNDTDSGLPMFVKPSSRLERSGKVDLLKWAGLKGNPEDAIQQGAKIIVSRPSKKSPTQELYEASYIRAFNKPHANSFSSIYKAPIQFDNTPIEYTNAAGGKGIFFKANVYNPISDDIDKHKVTDVSGFARSLKDIFSKAEDATNNTWAKLVLTPKVSKREQNPLVFTFWKRPGVPASEVMRNLSANDSNSKSAVELIKAGNVDAHLFSGMQCIVPTFGSDQRAYWLENNTNYIYNNKPTFKYSLVEMNDQHQVINFTSLDKQKNQHGLVGPLLDIYSTEPSLNLEIAAASESRNKVQNLPDIPDFDKQASASPVFTDDPNVGRGSSTSGLHSNDHIKSSDRVMPDVPLSAPSPSNTHNLPDHSPSR